MVIHLEIICTTVKNMDTKKNLNSFTCKLYCQANGTGEWDGDGNGNGNGDGNGKVPPVPGDDSIILGATNPITFNHEGVL